jgi:hypothetical protein
LGMFSVIMFSNKLSMSLVCIFSPSFTLMIHRFGLQWCSRVLHSSFIFFFSFFHCLWLTDLILLLYLQFMINYFQPVVLCYQIFDWGFYLAYSVFHFENFDLIFLFLCFIVVLCGGTL